MRSFRIFDRRMLQDGKMDWFTTTASINWLTIFLVGLTLFMVGGGAQALLHVDKKDTEVLEFFLTVAKRLGIVLAFAGVALWGWLTWR